MNSPATSPAAWPEAERQITPRRIALAQLVVVGGYTAGLSLLAPTLWADPYGGLMKNLPILVLLLVHLVLVEER